MNDPGDPPVVLGNELDPNTIPPGYAPATWVVDTGIARVQDAISEYLSSLWASDEYTTPHDVIRDHLLEQFRKGLCNMRGRVLQELLTPTVIAEYKGLSYWLFRAGYQCMLFRDSTQASGQTLSSLTFVNYDVLIWAHECERENNRVCSMVVLVGPRALDL